MGADIDPIKIISRIHNKLSIPGLRDSLVKILQDYNLQVSLHGWRRSDGEGVMEKEWWRRSDGEGVMHEVFRLKAHWTTMAMLKWEAKFIKSEVWFAFCITHHFVLEKELGGKMELNELGRQEDKHSGGGWSCDAPYRWILLRLLLLVYKANCLFNWLLFCVCGCCYCVGVECVRMSV